jgi:RHS repeat-associated protein
LLLRSRPPVQSGGAVRSGDAYGKWSQYTAAWVSFSLQVHGNPFAFTSRELDYLDGGSLHLTHYRARTTDPETGRFMQRDPLGIDPAGGNQNLFDPDDANFKFVDYAYYGSLVAGKDYPSTTNDLESTVTYDEYGRIDRLKTLNSSNAGVDFEYAYDGNGNITNKIFHHRDSQAPPENVYGYDDLNRVIAADYLDADGQAFDYDLLGNRNSVYDARTTVTCNYAHNVANEYTAVCGTAVTHDDAGNLTADHRGYTYRYDYENRLVEIRKNGDTITVAAFTYDALGRRIEKVDAIAGSTTRYYYDDQRVLLETDATGTEFDLRYFVFGNYIDEVLMMHVISAQAGIQDFYYGHDHLYSAVALFDGNGTVVERYEYDAYGKAHIMDASYNSRTASSYAMPYTFTGRRLDVLDGDDLNLMYYRARTYDPEIGRFMQRDPLGYVDGMCLYEYVRSEPLKYLDPLGNMADPATRTACGLLAQGKSIEEVIQMLIFMGLLATEDAADFEIGLRRGTTTCPAPPPAPPKPKPEPKLEPTPTPTPEPAPMPLPCPGDCGPQYPGEGMKPPGDCSVDRYKELREAVVAACKKGKILSCIPKCTTDRQRSINQVRLVAINACIAAREALDNECFRGGDKGHNQQRDQLRRMKEKCEKYLSSAGS